MQEAGWDSKKFLIDGYPRNEDNVQGWKSIIGETAEIAKVLYLDVDDVEMEARIAERAKTGARNDDTPQTLSRRAVQF